MEKILLAKTGDKKSMEEIIKSYTPYIIKTARTIYVKGYELEDLIQIGQLSIIRAVKSFDVHRSKNFTTYATKSVSRAYYSLIRKNIKTPSCCSINSINNEGCELIESIASEENLEEKTVLKMALQELTAECREIIQWIYFENKTLELYAEKKGISYRTAIRWKKRALEKLRKLLK